MGQFALANGLYADQQADEARNAFKRATTLDPTMGAAWLNLGILLLQNDEPEEARAALNKAANLEGEWQDRAQQLLDGM